MQDPDLPTTPAEDLALLIEAAQDAGRIALGFSHGKVEQWEKPDDQGPVTEADLAVNTALRARLKAARPDYGWLSEESPEDPERLDAPRVFIIDPIDGTRAFIEGSHAWAHSLAVAEHGRIIAAVVFLPVMKRMFSAARGTGAFLNGDRLACSARDQLSGATLLAPKVNFSPELWQGPLPEFTRAYRPSLAYRLSLVAQGRFDGMLTLRPSWEWDIAAGSLIAEEAGASVSDRSGTLPLFNRAHPQLDGVVVAAPAVHQQLIARLTPTEQLPDRLANRLADRRADGPGDRHPPRSAASGARP